MLKRVLLVTIAVTAVVLLPAPASAQLSDLRQALDFAREKVYPALVNISVVSEDMVGGRTRRFPSAGSGVVVSPAGHVITNYHVAGDAAIIHCTLPTGETLDADIVAADPYTDLCILKVRLHSRQNPTMPIPFATIGDSDALTVGDHVLAMGNPLSLSSSMTLGIVSNKKRVFTDFTGTEIDEFSFDEGQSTGIYNQWIQTDALILPGNSGGPLVNLRGEVIGINARGGNGVGFAIPSHTIKQVLNQALTFGEVRRGWMGFTVLPVGKAGLSEGAWVAAVLPGSPAERAGLLPGDVVRAFDGVATDVRFFEEVPLLYQRIAEMAAGKRVDCEYSRAGELRACVIEVAPLERYLGEEREFRSMGLTVREITRPLAVARQYPSADGVLVTGLRAGRPFEEAKPPVPAGAVIIAAAGRQVTDLAAFAAILADAPDKMPVTFRAGDEVVVTLIDLSKDEPQRVGHELPKAWLGVRTQVLTEDVSEALGMPGTHGFRITQVYPSTAAEAAGLQAGDVLLSLDDEPLDAFRPQDAMDLQRAVEDMFIGDEIDFEVLREGVRMHVVVELEETPTTALDVKVVAQEELEFKARAMTFMDRVRQKWDANVHGLLVTEVTSGGWADISGLRINDLIVSVNGQQIVDTQGFETTMDEVMKARPRIITIHVLRGARAHFVFIEPDWSKLAE